MAVLVYAEHDNASLKGATLNTVSAAKAIGGDIHVLVAGSNCQAAAQAAAQIAGVSKVLVADNAAYANQLAENVSLLVAELGKGYSHILAAATTTGKNFAPRAAALLDVGQISEITKVVSADTFERPIYAGNAIATVQSSDSIKVITVRATGFDAAAATGGSAAVEAVGSATDAGTSKFVSEELAKSDRPELTAAKIVVSAPRHGQRRQLQDPLQPGRQAGRRRGGFPRRCRRRFRAERHAGRSNRQDRGPATVCRRRYFRRHPASGRHEGLQGHRRHQQG